MNDKPFIVWKKGHEPEGARFIEHFYYLGLPLELSKKLVSAGIQNEKNLMNSCDYIDDITLEEFEELRKFILVTSDFIDGKENVENITDVIPEETAISLCSRYEECRDISIDSMKIRVNMAYLLLLERQRKIIKYQFFSEDGLHLNVHETAGFLQVEESSVILAGASFLRKIQFPIRGRRLADFLD